MESITLFWDDKITKTEEDLKKEIQILIMNHIQELQEFDSLKHISQQPIPEKIQILPSYDGTIKARAIESTSGSSNRNIRTGDQRAIEEHISQRKLIIERQKSEIMKFNKDSKSILNDLVQLFINN